MKKLLLTMTATLVCVGAFAQGQFNFILGNDNLIYFTTDTSKLIAADKNTMVDAGYGAGSLSLAGQTLVVGQNYAGDAPGTVASLATPASFLVTLWAGTSSSALTQVTTTTLGDANNPGGFNSQNVTLAGFPAGTPAWFQIQIYDTTGGAVSYGTAHALGHYAGETAPFLATPSDTPLPIGQVQTPVNSGLVSGSVGGFIPFDVAPINDPLNSYYGGIEITAGAVPEPGTFALAGLGIAAMLVLRRRNS